jgi:hypothetical protein
MEAQTMLKKTAASKGKAKIHKVMREFKEGDLKSGPGGKGGTVKRRDQAIAIALSEAREAGAKIPRKSS